MSGIQWQSGKRPVQALSALLLVALGATGCAHVKPEQLETELDRLRGEMAEGDRAVEDRLRGEMTSMEGRMDGRLTALERAVEGLGEEFRVTVERLETAIRFNTPVHFAFDDDAIRSEDVPLLDRMAGVLQEFYPEAVLTVEGFADPAGSRDYNLRLGQRRAESVRAHLVRRGLPESRIRAVSYGSAQERQVVPGARGPGGEGWQNRRVAVVVDFAPGDLPPRVAGSTGGS